MKAKLAILMFCLATVWTHAWAQKPFHWDIGGYAGKYYDTDPGEFVQGNVRLRNHHVVALTGSTTVWRSREIPLSLELDGTIGQQFGQESLSEISVIPVLRWSGFPWNHVLRTDLRVGPVGVSYTSQISQLERGPRGQGSQWLSSLLLEVAFSAPSTPSRELFVRLHHRCNIYGLLNDYGANGQDFVVMGYRHRF